MYLPLSSIKCRVFFFTFFIYLHLICSCLLILSLVHFKDRKNRKKKCVAKNALAAEDSSLCASKSACATKCDLTTTQVDGRNPVNPSTRVCSASERDRAVENALITCKVDGTAANDSVVANENKTPISEVVTSSDFSYKPKVRCSVALSSGHGSGRHSYRPSAHADSHVSAACHNEPSHSTQVCVYRCSRNSCQGHCH